MHWWLLAAGILAGAIDVARQRGWLHVNTNPHDDDPAAQMAEWLLAPLPDVHHGPPEPLQPMDPAERFWHAYHPTHPYTRVGAHGLWQHRQPPTSL